MKTRFWSMHLFFVALLVWLLFGSLAWFHACISHSLLFAAKLASGHLCLDFLMRLVAWCSWLLVCFVLFGGLLIDGAGAWMVWLGGLLLAWLVVWLCFACFVSFASRCDLPVLAVGWFCIA